MNEIMEAINLAFEKYRETYGEDAHLEDGEEFVTVFNNCVLIVSLENGDLKTKFIGGKPFEVDMTLSIYQEELV
jgi:tyrosyl-tRNA synthetase